MLFKSLLQAKKSKKACSGTGKGTCYIIGRKYYDSKGKLVLIY